MNRPDRYCSVSAQLTITLALLCATQPVIAKTPAKDAASLKPVRQMSTPRHGVFEAVEPTQPATRPLRLVHPAAVPGGSVPGFTVDSQFEGVGLIQTIALGSGAIPPDMGGAASGQYVLQVVNGGVAVFSLQGTLLTKLKTDSEFWIQAGIPHALVDVGVSDPRVYWDAASQRFFVSQINVSTPNSVFIGVSKSADPTQGFRAVSVTEAAAVLGDFPTLGVNANAVTVSTNNFDATGFVSLSVYSIPKADLLLPKPSLANLARYDGINPSTYGFAVHAVESQNPGNRMQDLLGVSATTLRQLDFSTLEGAGTSHASLTPATVVTTRFDGSPGPGRQPGGTPYDNGDDRISSDVKEVGKYIYFANVANYGAAIKNANFIHWGIIDRATKQIVSEGTISDPAHNIDYSYPSIDGNSNGRFVVGYNSSSAKANISANMTICDFNHKTLVTSCTAPKSLAVGVDGNYDLGLPGLVRWGDYSAVQLDATNPKAFWLFLEVPGPRQLNAAGVLRARWTTVITHVVTADPTIAP